MLIEALKTAAGPASSDLFRGLPASPGFEGGRQHLKDGEQFDVTGSIAKQKLALRSGPEGSESPIFREVTKVTE